MRVVTRPSFVAPILAILLPALSNAWPASETSPTAETTAYPSLVLEDPWPARLGIAPYFGHQTLWLQKRECLENGSNFCFEDPRRLCPDCGGCCELGGDEWCCPGEGDTCCPGETCCKADEACCGDGCCPKGRRCSDGKCEAPVVTVTSTKTVHATRTHSEVEVVTVEVNVRVTSTLNSIVTTTITSERGTQTDVTYETTTLVAKRSLPSPALEHRPRCLEWDTGDEPQGAVARGFSRFWRRLVFGGDLQRPGRDGLLAPPTWPQWRTSGATDLWRRQDDDDASRVTVTATTTIVDKTTTVKESKTTTDFVTSTVTKTIFQTSTRVVGARETVSTTSTVTITSRSPTTDTVTSTSTDFLDPTGDSESPATTSSPEDDTRSSSGLTTPAMIGIGVGTGFTALSLAILALLLLLRRSRKKKKAAAFPPDYILAPAPAPIPSPRRDAYFASKEKSPGHSRGASAATTQGSSGRASSDNRAAEGTQRRNIPHPSSSSVGRMTRFAELEGAGPGGMG